jgi:hypothetical protein
MFKSLLRFFYRDPDFVIVGKAGDTYMRRWYVLPKNRWFNIYLHNQVRDDEDSELHDHPWWNVSLVLKGGYWETTPRFRNKYMLRRMTEPHARMGNSGFVAYMFEPPHHRQWRKPGSVIFRRATDAHRLGLGFYGEQRMLKGSSHEQSWKRPSWSLFITGPNRRVWGFWMKDGWKPHTDIADTTNGVSKHKQAASGD